MIHKTPTYCKILWNAMGGKERGDGRQGEGRQGEGRWATRRGATRQGTKGAKALRIMIFNWGFFRLRTSVFRPLRFRSEDLVNLNSVWNHAFLFFTDFYIHSGEKTVRKSNTTSSILLRIHYFWRIKYQSRFVKDFEYANLLPQSSRRRRRVPQSFYSTAFFAKLCVRLCGSLRLNFCIFR